MTTSFAPGLRPSIGLGGFAANSALDFAAAAIMPTLPSPAGTGVSAARSALEFAVAAVAPEGLGPLAPLWKLLYGFIKRRANVDITSITRKVLIAFGAAVGIRYAWGYAKPFVLEHLTSSIAIPVEHKIARGILKWLDAQGAGRANRHLKYTVSTFEWNVATQTEDFTGAKRTAMTDGVFFFEKRPLFFSFQAATTKEDKEKWVGGRPNEYGLKEQFQLSGERVTVYALDPSGSFLQRFIDHVSIEDVKETRITPVFTVAPDPNTRGLQLWKQRIKPVRPLSTIDLDTQVKADLISDLDRFLSPNRAKWYSARGIPYKRGILLQGPPGTGKSSISLALAGHIRGSLYTVAIGKVRNEGHLMELFQSAGHGSCVLLEDVDSAGIGRENVSKDSKDFPNASKNGDKTPGPAGASASPISLSGLLNAIDALADGVVLIMTTNEPENLDKALIRPGRIDKQIHVGHASRAVAENIFKRFYSTDGNDEDVLEANFRIAELAAEFAGKIPDLKFTPAEIQGFLIPLSDTPEKAIEDADRWVADLWAAKAAGKNVVGSGSDSNSDTFYYKDDDPVIAALCRMRLQLQ
ncbi:P-loop containing nucleoside triphosphate hydrolase protein [Karstenula rhodostoma CBS 690.94]|uniref:P-loop containing nucleoside triphosphate hydrolase protein n=1 Tax=Karstenula rhodostoma CBS 690.94 TaxID=1392251 RepID=A0A9P4PPD0_9PLEO|nr:P-loop containing nucleoside triphosphate hydrolase protein [Karstenula rhodostoma CBS 690.94]